MQFSNVNGFSLYVWVPCSGWTLIRKWAKISFSKAVEFAAVFEPLEIKLVNDTTGRSYLGGSLCWPESSLSGKSIRKSVYG